MGQVSGKAGGYYGCLGAAKRACSNKLLVPRRFLEKRILAQVAQRISNAAAVHYVLERVALEVKRLHTHLPEKVKLARAALAAEERRVVNYIAFIGAGKGTLAENFLWRGQFAEAISHAEPTVALYTPHRISIMHFCTERIRELQDEASPQRPCR
jgi:hypothetical protein